LIDFISFKKLLHFVKPFLHLLLLVLCFPADTGACAPPVGGSVI